LEGGKGLRGEGKGRREKGEGRREKGEGRRENQRYRFIQCYGGDSCNNAIDSYR